MSKSNFEVHMKHLNGHGEMKLMIKFDLNFEIYFLEFLWEIVFGVISGNYLSL